jgi:Notch-like protein
LVNNFRCTCYLGWTGILCDRNIDYCIVDSSRFGPCDDLGTRICIDGNSTYTCECMDGYAGYNCSIDIDPCDPHPCQNNGTCTNISITVFECTCLEGYSGSTCNIDLTPCEPDRCNGGICIDYSGGVYTCECSLPYYLDTLSAVISCVAQCPLLTFGNHTSGQCQPCKCC